MASRATVAEATGQAPAYHYPPYGESSLDILDMSVLARNSTVKPFHKKPFFGDKLREGIEMWIYVCSGSARSLFRTRLGTAGPFLFTLSSRLIGMALEVLG